MKTWLDRTKEHLQRGEALFSGSVGAMFIDKLCTGAERWQAAIRKNQASDNFAEILRARALCNH